MMPVKYNMLNEIIDHANDAVFANHLTATGTYGTFLYVSRLLCQRLRYTRDELLNMDPYIIFQPEDRAWIDESITTLIEKQHHIYETILMGRKHHRLPVEVSASLFNLDGRSIVISIARDITDRRIAQRRQEDISQRLRKLASRIQSIREEERAVIAREIHDDLGQNLTVLKIRLALLCDQNPEIKQDSRPVLLLIDQIVERVQTISAKLRPGMLDELGLIPAIEWQSQDFQQSTGILCECRLPADDIVIDDEKATAVFRIFQETLTNVARHARATRVSVNLTCENNSLIMEVTDNGIGISRAQIENFMSLGLLGMKERAMIFGGDLNIRGVPGKGTNLKLNIPLNNKKEASNANT